MATLDDWYLTEPVSQAFAVVDTGGLGGVDIYNSHRYVATTNEDGKALVPHLLANLPNYISLDPLQLPLDSQVQSYQHNVTPAGITGIRLKFNIDRQPLLLLRIRLPSGAVAALGSQLYLPASNELVASVGWDGESQLPSRLAGSQLRLQQPDGQSCLLELPPSPVSRSFTTLQCQGESDD